MIPSKNHAYYWKRIRTRKWWNENAYWFFRHGMWQAIGDIPRNTKAFFQRGYRGYADQDLWSLDDYLCAFMPEALRQLAKNVHGHPASLLPDNDYNDESLMPDDYGNDEDFDIVFETWKTMLNTMAEGFEAHRTLCDEPWLDASPPIRDIRDDNDAWHEWYDAHRVEFIEEAKRLEKVRDHGLTLFVKWFGALWD